MLIAVDMCAVLVLNTLVITVGGVVSIVTVISWLAMPAGGLKVKVILQINSSYACIFSEHSKMINVSKIKHELNIQHSI